MWVTSCEQVDVGRQRGQGAVEEQQVLDEQHELLREAGAVGRAAP